MRPSYPRSTSAVTMSSPTPPERRVSSTTRTRRKPEAYAASSSTGSGASQRRSSAVALERPARAQRHRHPVAEGDDEEVAPVAVGTWSARSAGCDVSGGPETVAGLVQVARVVERDRLDHDADPALELGELDALPHQ